MATEEGPAGQAREAAPLADERRRGRATFSSPSSRARKRTRSQALRDAGGDLDKRARSCGANAAAEDAQRPGDDDARRRGSGTGRRPAPPCSHMGLNECGDS